MIPPQDLPGLSAVDGQLRSLTGRAPALPSEALLHEVWAVGSGLTSLELFMKGGCIYSTLSNHTASPQAFTSCG